MAKTNVGTQLTLVTQSWEDNHYPHQNIRDIVEFETDNELEVSKKQENTLKLKKETSTAQVNLLNKNFPVYPKENIK